MAVALVAPPTMVAAATAIPDGAEFQVNTYTTGSQPGPNLFGNGVAVSHDGASGFVVVWTQYGSDGTDTDGSSIRARRFDATGSGLGPDFQVNTYTTGYQGSYGVVAVGPDGAGGFVVAWSSDGSAGTDSYGKSIQARRFDSTGSPVGSDFQVNSYTTGDQGVAGPVGVGPDGAGGFVVVWPSYGSGGTDSDLTSVQGRRFDAAGVPAGPDFQVNTYTTGRQGYYGVAVSADGGGGFVVAWNGPSGGTDVDNGSVQARRFDSSGTPLGSDFQVNTVTTGYQGSYNGGVTVGPDGAGGFVVAWASYYVDGSNFAQVARQFDNTGTALGPDFQVNSYTTGIQGSEGAAVVADGAGGFVVAWGGYGGGTDTSIFGVQARQFDSLGLPVANEFQVNTYTYANQGYRGGVAAAPDGGGGFVIVWSSQFSSGSDTSSYSVQAQRFVTPTTLPPSGGDVGITGKKLIIVDKLTAASKAKIAYVAKDTTAAKGTTNDQAQISASLAYQVPTLGASGSADMPQGGNWVVNKETVAKYVNKDAPTGGAVKVGVIKPGKLLKAVLKDLGDSGSKIDIYQGGAETSPVDATTQLTVFDGSTTVRHCGEFTECVRKLIAGGTGAKVVCKAPVDGASVVCP